MAATLTALSSMATRQILTTLVAGFNTTGRTATVLSVGGVDAAKRLRSGETFDVVVLASDALLSLADDGFVVRNSVREFARSPTAVAVPAAAPHPRRCDETALRTLVAGAMRIGLSTGPSGKSMERLLNSWGINHSSGRIVQAPPGVPVAQLLARGEADVGFQQLSELLGEPGVEIVGTLPETLLPLTVFSCGIGQGAVDLAAAQDLLAWLVSSDATLLKRQGGMEPGMALQPID